MNVRQLELKRLKEALASVRHARHVARAVRKPLAQAMRLEHAANVRLSAIELRKVRKRVRALREKKAETAAAAAVNETDERVLMYLDMMANEVRSSNQPGHYYGLGLAGLRDRGRHELADQLKTALATYREATQ